nr:MAG TPA: hypothetical protein [Bacteriophage sp.]
MRGARAEALGKACKFGRAASKAGPMPGNSAM